MNVSSFSNLYSIVYYKIWGTMRYSIFYTQLYKIISLTSTNNQIFFSPFFYKFLYLPFVYPLIYCLTKVSLLDNYWCRTRLLHSWLQNRLRTKWESVATENCRSKLQYRNWVYRHYIWRTGRDMV